MYVCVCTCILAGTSRKAYVSRTHIMLRPLGNKIIYALAHSPATRKGAAHEYFILLNTTGVIIVAGCGRQRPTKYFLKVICEFSRENHSDDKSSPLQFEMLRLLSLPASRLPLRIDRYVMVVSRNGSHRITNRILARHGRVN